MALAKWTPTTDSLTLRRMGKLIEELGELSNVAGRVIIQGMDEIDPGTMKVNRQRLQEEISDVLAQIDVTIEDFGLDLPQIAIRTMNKVEQMREWDSLVAE